MRDSSQSFANRSATVTHRGVAIAPFSGTWDRKAAAHLVRRTSFGAIKREVDRALNDGSASAAVQRIIATAQVEELIDQLRRDYAVVIVTHSMQQAARVSRRVAYFHLGRLVEVDDTDKIFTNPQHKLTENYITGRFG